MIRSNVFADLEEIRCSLCGKNLSKVPSMGIVVGLRNIEKGTFTDVRVCCKNTCFQSIMATMNENEIITTQDLLDLMNPEIYMKTLMKSMNGFYKGKCVESERVFEDYKYLMLSIYPYVSRNLSEAELIQVEQIKIFP